MKKLALIGMACALLASSVAFAKYGNGKGHHFGKIDADSDGKITREEMVDEAKARASRRFDHVDENKDGSVSKEELQKSKEQFKNKWRKRKEKRKDTDDDDASDD